MNSMLIENNYVYIPGFISKERAKVLANNFEHFCKENNILGDEQIPASNSSYNYIDFLELLCNSTPEVGEFIGESVLPTYTYSRVYKKGAELHAHKDRDACEISLTVHLDGDKEWPIFIKNPKGETIKLNLSSGDAMIYLGCEAEHWREMYDGERYVQVFLHYVRSRGDKSYAYFDKNKQKLKDDVNLSNEKSTNEFKKDKEQEVYKINSESKLVDFIEVYENILPNSLCDEIIREYSNDNNLTLAPIGSEIVQDNTIRNVLTVLISDAGIISSNEETRRNIDNRVHSCLIEAMLKYREKHPTVNITRDSGYSFLKYSQGNFYKEHTDSFTQEPRSVSCSIALNDIDEYDGGEFAFFNNEIRYKLKKGSVIMFPSSYMYPHEILTVTKGIRYSIVTWFL